MAFKVSIGCYSNDFAAKKVLKNKIRLKSIEKYANLGIHGVFIWALCKI